MQCLISFLYFHGVLVASLLQESPRSVKGVSRRDRQGGSEQPAIYSK